MVMSHLTNRFATYETGSTKPRPVHTCTRCGCRMERKRQYCQPCSSAVYEERIQARRVRANNHYRNVVKPLRGPNLAELGRACRTAGITLADIERIKVAKARWEGETNG